MALQESTALDFYQTYFEPMVYLDYFKMGQSPVGDDCLYFLLKHYNAIFKSGASFLEPWRRFVGGRVAMQILNQMLVFFNPRASFRMGVEVGGGEGWPDN